MSIILTGIITGFLCTIITFIVAKAILNESDSNDTAELIDCGITTIGEKIEEFKKNGSSELSQPFDMQPIIKCIDDHFKNIKFDNTPVKNKETRVTITGVKRQNKTLIVSFDDNTTTEVILKNGDTDDPFIGILYAIAKHVMVDINYIKTLESFAKKVSVDEEKIIIEEPKPEIPKTKDDPIVKPQEQPVETSENIPPTNEESVSVTKKIYSGYLLMFSHKTINQTNFMDADGNYVSYEEGCNNATTDIKSIVSERNDYVNDPEFTDFLVKICAISNDGPKILTDDEIKELVS